MSIPNQYENPNGLHKRYEISKIDGTPVDDEAEYFVLRLDNMGDPEHVAASRRAIAEYANAIEHTMPMLAHDLRARYVW